MKDDIYQELAEAERNAKKEQKKVEPSEEEKRNGWTTDTLTAYLAERQAGQSLSIDVNSAYRKQARMPVIQNHKYNPHRWRG